MSLRQQKKLIAKQKIVTAAELLIAQRGVADTSTRQIAQQAGVSYQTLYNYFPSKALLVRELLNEEVGLWSQQVDQLLKSYDGDLIGSLLALCELSVDLIQGPNEALWRALAQQKLAQPADHEQHASWSTIAHEHFYALLNSAQGMGHLVANIDLHLLAHTLYSLCDYNLLNLHLQPIQKSQYLEIQQQQLHLVLDPYLILGRR